MFGLFAWRGTAPCARREQARHETCDLLGIKPGERLLAARGWEHSFYHAVALGLLDLGGSPRKRAV